MKIRSEKKLSGNKIISSFFLKFSNQILIDREKKKGVGDFSFTEKKFLKTRFNFSKIWVLKKGKLVYKRKILCEFFEKIYFSLIFFWTFSAKKTKNETKFLSFKLKLLENSLNVKRFFFQLNSDFIDLIKKICSVYSKICVLKKNSETFQRLQKKETSNFPDQCEKKLKQRKKFLKVISLNSKTNEMVFKIFSSFALFQLRILFELKNIYRKISEFTRRLNYLKKKISTSMKS